MNYLPKILYVLNLPLQTAIKNGHTKGWKYKASRNVSCGVELALIVPLGSSIEEAEKALPALIATCGKEIEIESYKGNVIFRIIEKDFPKEMKFNPKHLVSDKLLIGYSRLLEPVYHPLNVHMLVAGAARAGKTDALRWFVYQFILQKYLVYICDLKEISFFPFEGLVTIAKSLEKSCEILEKGVKELERRKKYIDDNRNRDLTATLQPMVIIVDEAAALAPSQYKNGKEKDLAWRCDNAIGLLGMQAREFKIFIIYATQRPDMNIINKLFKATVEASIAFRTKDGMNSKIIIDHVGAEKISPSTPGRCIYAYDKDYLLQVPYIGGDKEWKKLLAPLKVEVIEDGNSKRSESQRTHHEGSYTSANSANRSDSQTIYKWLTIETSKRESERTRETKTGGMGLAQTRKSMANHYPRIEINGDFTDEI